MGTEWHPLISLAWTLSPTHGWFHVTQASVWGLGRGGRGDRRDVPSLNRRQACLPGLRPSLPLRLRVTGQGGQGRDHCQGLWLVVVGGLSLGDTGACGVWLWGPGLLLSLAPWVPGALSRLAHGHGTGRSPPSRGMRSGSSRGRRRPARARGHAEASGPWRFRPYLRCEPKWHFCRRLRAGAADCPSVPALGRPPGHLDHPP